MLTTTCGKFDFNCISREEVIREGFKPDFPPEVISEVTAMRAAPVQNGGGAEDDLRSLLWSSIDNTESRDLDQVEWAEKLPDGKIRVLVGIADVDGTVKSGSATDAHARANATSVYTGGPVFPMLPERLSTDLTSLKQDEDRSAIIMEFVVSESGEVICVDARFAMLRNKAKLNYDQVAKCLKSPAQAGLPADLMAQLTLQQEASQRLKTLRKENGALEFDSREYVPIIVNDTVHGFDMAQQTPARDIIENFMVAANVAMARFLKARKLPAIRRIVRTPKRWDRIQAIAAEHGTKLPNTPDPKSLSEFMAARKEADPEHFPELSLAILKSLGPGEYVAEHPGTEHEGHFGLAVADYTHSTAPNRRYADLIMQRLLKAAIRSAPCPYSESELSEIAVHCTERETAARKVERFMKKVAAAVMLASRVGETFDAIVTGVTQKGTFVRLLKVPAEGRIIRGEKGLDVGQKIRARLIGTDPPRGFIDFQAVT